jgi:hypothetical protein
MRAFGEHAVVCVARSGREVTLDCSYYGGRFSLAERVVVALTIEDWRRLQDALIEARFWSLPPTVPSGGALDGYELIVEGRRGSVFRTTRMTNPSAAELRQLGRVAFDLAGPAEVRL